MSKKRGPDEVSPLVREMAEGMDAVIADLKADGSIEKHMIPPPPRDEAVDLVPRDYKPDDVKAVRERFRATQATMARFLGVSLPALRKWEQGQRPVPTMAARYLDDLQEFPQLWDRRVKRAKA